VVEECVLQDFPRQYHRSGYVVLADDGCVLGILGRLALESPLAEQIVHEGADVEAQLGPEPFVVRLENRTPGAAIQAFFSSVVK
jgi:hypothetical protein